MKRLRAALEEFILRYAGLDLDYYAFRGLNQTPARGYCLEQLGLSLALAGRKRYKVAHPLGRGQQRSKLISLIRESGEHVLKLIAAVQAGETLVQFMLKPVLHLVPPVRVLGMRARDAVTI